MATGVTIDFTANLARFSSSLDKATNDLGKFQSNIQRRNKTLGKSFKALGGVLAGAFAGIGFKSMIDEAVNASSEINNLSTRLGGTVEEWSRLSHAAEQTDVGFKTAAMAAQRMTRRIAEAANGSGEAVGALNELGLSAKKLQELTPTEQLKVLADALQGVEKQSDKVRLAMKLFDSEGVKMLQMLEGGSSAMRQLEQESDKFGKTLSREGVERMRQYEMALKDARSASDGFGNQLAIALGPTLAEITHWLADALPAAAKIAGGWLEALAQQTKTTAEWFAAWQMGDISFWEWLTSGNEEAAEKLKELKARFGDTAEGVEDLKNTVGEFNVELGNSLPSLDSFAGHNERVGTSAKEAAEDVDDLGRALDLIDAQFKELDEAYARQIAGLDDVGDAFKDTAEEIRDEWDDVLDIYIAEEQRNQQLWARQQAGLDNFKNQGKEVGDVWQELGGTFESAFEDAIVNGEKLSDVIKALEKDIIRLITRELVTKPIAGFFTDFAKDLFPSFGGGKASGGAVLAGRYYEVNEKGPELLSVGGRDYLMMGNQAGRVTPNDKLGGTTINVNVNGVRDGGDLQASAGQVAAKVAQLVNMGRRNL